MKVRRLLVTLLAFMLIFSFFNVANASDKIEAKVLDAEIATNAYEQESVGAVDILEDISPQGDYPPSSSAIWNLSSSSYNYSGKFYNYTYTNYRFRPNSDGKLRLYINAKEMGGRTTTLYYSVYDGNNSQVLTVNLGAYSRWNTTRIISNLKTSQTYYIRLHKPDDGLRIECSGTVSHP